MAFIGMAVLAVFVVVGVGALYSAKNHAGTKSAATTLSIDKHA